MEDCLDAEMMLLAEGSDRRQPFADPVHLAVNLYLYRIGKLQISWGIHLRSVLVINFNICICSDIQSQATMRL